jgi:hypothetical protein
VGICCKNPSEIGRGKTKSHNNIYDCGACGTGAVCDEHFIDNFFEMSMDPKKLKVAELKEELQKRGLDTGGVKLDLQQRLQVKIISIQI